MSSGQWEALPQRTRKRRPAASKTSAGSQPCPPQPPADEAAPAATEAETKVWDKSVPAVEGGDRQHHQQHRIPSSSGDSSSVHTSQPPPETPGGSRGVQDSKSCGEPQRHESRRGNVSSVGGGGGPPPLASPERVGVGERTDEGGRQSGGKGQGGTVDAATMSARHAAVATAVDARSKMARFSEGLGGGAGADGGADGEANFEYLDHTADVQLHSWGDSIERAMEGALAAMFNTITDIAKVDIDPSLTKSLDIEGHDAKSLLFSLLDEFLFLFHSEGLVVKKATINGTIDRADSSGGGGGDSRGGDGSGGDGSNPPPRWRVRATAEGETFDLAKHPQGTEVKAITYSNMQINEIPGGRRTDIYVIVDI